MTVAGVKTARTHVRPGRMSGRSAQPVLVARVTLLASDAPAIQDPPAMGDLVNEEPVLEEGPVVLASRRDIHVARKLRRRDALLGLGVLATTLGATVAVLDMLH